MITVEQLEQQATSLARTTQAGIPPQVGAIVIFINHETGDVVLRAVNMNHDIKNQILRALADGTGKQTLTETGRIVQ